MTETVTGNNAKLMRLAKKCLLFSIIAHLLASYFSIGYIHYDEHFQILEFAGYKLGITPLNGLAWDYSALERPAMQPAFVVAIMNLLGSHPDPLICAFILRIFSSLIGLGSLVLTVFIGLQWLTSYAAKRFLILAASLIWFFPYIHSHFSAESISGSLFFIGAGCIYLGNNKLPQQKKKNTYLLLPGGFSLGLSFVCRYQIAFMIFGLAVWCIFIAKFSFRKILFIALPLLFAISIGFILDHWFYGQWLFTELNYFKVQLIQGKAAEFGIQPWWSFFKWAGRDMILPFSIAIIAGILYSFYIFPKNILVLSLVPFIIMHIIIGHKEPRFMYPLIDAIPVLLALVFNEIQNIFSRGKKYWQWVFILFWGANIVYMAASCLKPASNNVQPFSYIYHHYDGKSASLLAFENNPYTDIGLTLYFYKPSDIRIYDSLKTRQVDSITSKLKGPVLLLSNNWQLDNEFTKTHPNAKLVYRSMPMWLDNFNVNNWLGKTSMYKLYELKP